MNKAIQNTKYLSPIIKEIPFNYSYAHSFIRQIVAQSTKRYESYCLSPAYYEITGRKGIWMYSQNNTLLIACNHPNISDKILIFPELANVPNYFLTKHVIMKLLEQNLDIQLARFTEDQENSLRSSLALELKIELKSTIEECLDWRFPVYMLDTRKVIERKGGGFAQLRQRLRKLDRSLIEVQAINISQDYEELQQHELKWASMYNHCGYGLEDLTGPALKLIDTYKKYPKLFSGQVLMINKKMVSYSIWENPVIPNLPANELIISSNNEIPGLSEWQMVLMCEELHRNEIDTVNIGGSETHGLDRYKRKFEPSESINVSTIAPSFLN